MELAHAAHVLAAAALAVRVQRVWVKLGEAARFARTPEAAQFWCAATSTTDAIGFDGLCAPTMPIKWEEITVNSVLSLTATLLLVAAWAASAARYAERKASATSPRPSRSVWTPALLHGGWLVLHSALDDTTAAYFGVHWACAWSWWATAVYAAARLAEAAWHRGGYGAPALPSGLAALPALFAGTAGLLLSTNVAFFCINQDDPVNVGLHAISIAYMAAAIALDERHRPRLVAHRAHAGTAVLASVLPAVVLNVYCVFFEPRDLYAPFLELETAPVRMTPWYPTFVHHYASALACVLCLWLYAEPGRRRGAWHLLLLLALTSVVPGALVLADPERHYLAHNCPRPPVPLARYNASSAQFHVDRRAWDQLAGDLRTPVYVHAIVSADPAAVAAELAHLEAHVVRRELRPSCLGRSLRLPADADADGGRTLWAWAIALRRTTRALQLRVISDDWRLQQRGTLLVLLAATSGPVGPASSPAALAATAYAPSVTLHLPRDPRDGPSVAAILDHLEGAAQWRSRGDGSGGKCRRRLADAGPPLKVDSMAARIPAYYESAAPESRLGRVALVATAHADVDTTASAPVFHAPGTMMAILHHDPALWQRWQALNAEVGLYALGLEHVQARLADGHSPFVANDVLAPWAMQHIAGWLAPARARDTGQWLQPDELFDDLQCFLRTVSSS